VVQPSVFGVAFYILKNCGELTTMKLHKLVYYCQAWSLVWDEKILFSSEIQAWANGPAIPDLYKKHKGMFSISSSDFSGNDMNLSSDQVETIDAVLSYYGDKPAQWLIDLSHQEDPWILARKGLKTGERGSHEITLESMANYYSSL